MNSWSLKFPDFMGSLSVLALLTFGMGCGAVGSPIPPEKVGIEAKVRKQQQKDTQSEAILTEDGSISVKDEGVELPVFYPIGAR
ncbi:MAG: hypothetical protein WD032_10195 [Nitrospirales bacterium]